MLDTISQIITNNNALSHLNEGIRIAKVKSHDEGIALAKEILIKITDIKTMLYLSGGRTPKDLYKTLATDESLEIGGAGLIDERYGEKWHKNSNEYMIKDTGFLRYLQMRDREFYSILHSDLPREETAIKYDKTIRELHTIYQKNIGILGIGLDGHTAGLPALSANVKVQNAKLYDEKYKMVTDYTDTVGMYGERVTMTFLGLSMLDVLLVLVFGDDKKEALIKMFEDGNEEELPSRFFKRPEVAKKTLLITDQEV